MLSVAIVKGTARVSISIILAVYHSALDSFLNLMRGNEKKSFNPPHKTRKSTFQIQWLSYVNAPPPLPLYEGCSEPWRWWNPPESRRWQTGSGRGRSDGQWWPRQQTSRWGPAGAEPHRSSKVMPWRVEKQIRCNRLTQTSNTSSLFAQ